MRVSAAAVDETLAHYLRVLKPDSGLWRLWRSVEGRAVQSLPGPVCLCVCVCVCHSVVSDCL